MSNVRTVKIQVDDVTWVKFRQLALEKELSTQALLGMCVYKHVLDHKKEAASCK